MTKRVAIVYHFFANYRKPILNELSRNQKFEFTFVADAVNRLMPEVETWKPQEPIQQARCFPIGGGFMIQTGLLKVAWKRDTDCIVFLGDWKWPMTWLGALLARFRGKRVLFWTHGWRTRDIGIKRAIRKLFYRLPHGLLLYGNRAAANVTVSPGPIGLTAIQSLTYGVPAITNDEFSTQGPEFEAIEPGVSGDFFPNSNLQELAYQIKKWTSTQFIAPHIRANCSSIVDRFYNPQFQATVFESAISSTPATEHKIGDKQNFHS